MRARTRPAPSAAALADHYTGGHDRRALGWMHDARITTAITLARFLLDDQTPERVADLSCGAPHAEVARAFHAPTTILSDLAPGIVDHHGPIEDTIHLLDGTMVDLFICLETLEHLADPDTVLREIRGRARHLVCSLPIWDRPEDELNGEHLWVFDRAGGEQMLRDAGWNPVLYAEVPAGPATGPCGSYQCATWGCS